MNHFLMKYFNILYEICAAAVAFIFYFMEFSQISTQKNQVMRAGKQEGMVLFVVQYHRKTQEEEEKYRKGTCCLCRCRQCEFLYNFHVSLMMRISTSQSLQEKKMKKGVCCFLPFPPRAPLYQMYCTLVQFGSKMSCS